MSVAARGQCYETLFDACDKACSQMMGRFAFCLTKFISSFYTCSKFSKGCMAVNKGKVCKNHINYTSKLLIIVWSHKYNGLMNIDNMCVSLKVTCKLQC